ncbi:MAG: hypothetical protein AAGA56_27530, partial [Myxococcota bacterium]
MATGCMSELPPPGDVQDLHVSAPTGRNGTTRLRGSLSPTPTFVKVSTEHRIRVRADACVGDTTPQPELVVDYYDPADALHIAFRNRHTPVSLLVRAPDGSWHCRGMLQRYAAPWIGFAYPKQGRYEIWVLRDEETSFSSSLDGEF